MVPPERTPPGLYRFRGALRPRRAALVLNLNRLTCPLRHKLRFHRNVAEDGYLECVTCEAIVLVHQLPAFGGRRHLFAIDVTEAERDWFNDQGMDFEAIVIHLELEFPLAPDVIAR